MEGEGTISGVAGMDLGDKTSTIRLLGLEGEQIDQVRITTSTAALRKYFSQWPRLRVVIETGVHVHWVARLLEQLQHDVVVANARQLQRITRSVSKNDRNDSQWLAELGRTNLKLSAPVRLRSQASQQHRTLLRAREAAVEAAGGSLRAEDLSNLGESVRWAGPRSFGAPRYSCPTRGARTLPGAALRLWCRLWLLLSNGSSAAQNMRADRSPA